MFDGLRVNDDGLLAQLLQNLRRVNGPGTALITDCEGEVCWVNAFAAPLVAQSIGRVTGTDAEWIFPGGRTESIPFAQLEVDEWNRFHAYVGEENLPAMLTRKAQAELLHRAPTDKIPERAFRSNEFAAQVTAPDFWVQAYRDGRDGWELGGPSPGLVGERERVLDMFKPGAKILVPGAGRGHDAEWLSSLGFQVTAIDFAPDAEQAFRARYPQSRVNFVRADVFEYCAHLGQTVDGIYERTFFCAIRPEQRRTWIQLAWRCLRPQAIYFGLFFLRSSPGGPPYGLTQWELRQYALEEHWDIRDWRISPHSIERARNQELWAALRVSRRA